MNDIDVNTTLFPCSISSWTIQLINEVPLHTSLHQIVHTELGTNEIEIEDLVLFVFLFSSI